MCRKFVDGEYHQMEDVRNEAVNLSGWHSRSKTLINEDSCDTTHA